MWELSEASQSGGQRGNCRSKLNRFSGKAAYQNREDKNSRNKSQDATRIDNPNRARPNLED